MRKKEKRRTDVLFLYPLEGGKKKKGKVPPLAQKKGGGRK